jgi:hypothetical protein
LKAAIEREESDARISYSEREQARPQVTVYVDVIVDVDVPVDRNNGRGMASSIIY